MRKGLAQQIQAPLKDFLLRRLAFEMHSQRTTTFSLAETRELMIRDLQERGRKEEFNVLFDEIVNRSGLLRVDGEEVRFRHLLLQEFFAGRGVPSPDFLRSAIFDRWWKEAIVFYFGENPSNHSALASFIRDLPAKTPSELYQAACTVGLALQACYMSLVSEKTETLHWVVKTLSEVKEDFVKSVGSYEPAVPLMTFLHYYIYARDSVSTKSINNLIEHLKKKAERGEATEETIQFWCIIGLIESGQLDVAEATIKKFKPSDSRLLLAIHLSCFVRSHLRVSTGDQKTIAERIYKKIEPKIIHLMDEVIEEMKGLLLEVQRGKVKALDSPESESVKNLTDDGVKSDGVLGIGRE
jgi:hypothetical protein